MPPQCKSDTFLSYRQANWLEVSLQELVKPGLMVSSNADCCAC